MNKFAELQRAVESGAIYSTFLISYHKTGKEYICYIRGISLDDPPNSYMCALERIDN
jgi:hypothetical protein